MRLSLSLASLALGLALLPPAVASAAPLRVFASPAGSGTACTKAAPCSLGTAVTTVRRGGSVYLQTGTYVGTGAHVVYVGKGLKLLGGWDGTTASPPVRADSPLLTVLDGQDARRAVTIGEVPGRVTIDNLSVAYGRSPDRGGGIFTEGAALTLRRILFYANKVAATAANNLDFGGGGVYVNGGSLKVVGSAFFRNGANNSGGYETYGGGIMLRDATAALVRATSFTENDARNGSGIYARTYDPDAPPAPVAIRDCAFGGNGSGLSGSGTGDYGGGAYLHQADAAITRCSFEGNAVTEAGSAVYGHFATMNLERATITGNAAGSGSAVEYFYGGGRVRNCILADNAVGSGVFGEAAAVHLVRPGVEVALVHNTLVGPAAAPRGIGVSAENDSRATLRNNIVARFDQGAYAWGSSEITAEGTLWGSGIWTNGADTATDANPSSTVTLGAGNLAGNPAFLPEAIAGPWRIGPTSAARKAALPTRLRTDVDGEPRGAKHDIGADEYMTRVLLLAPDGGQVLGEGASAEVRWGAPVTAETFKLSYSLNGGASWRLIGKGLTGRSHTWTVPQVNATSGSCLVRVIGYDGGGQPVGSDRSDAVFTIRDRD